MYDYGYADYSSSASMLGGLAAMSGIMMLMSLAIAVITIVSTWKIYTKAGKKGWASIIPIYNTVVLIQIAELPIWYVILFFVPLANIYAMFKVYIELAHKFGKSTGFGVATVFFNFICLPILAFSKNSVYVGGNNNTTQVNNMQFNQFNPAEALQTGLNNVENNTNQNSPFMFDQNINTQINPIPTVQTEQPVTLPVTPEVAANVVTPVEPTPVIIPQPEANVVPLVETQPVNNVMAPQQEVPQTNPIVYNTAPVTEEVTSTIPTAVNTETEPVPVEPILVQQPQVINEVPSTQPIEVQPQMVTPGPQVNVIPGMGATPQPVIQPQNPQNNQNNTTM